MGFVNLGESFQNYEEVFRGDVVDWSLPNSLS